MKPQGNQKKEKRLVNQTDHIAPQKTQWDHLIYKQLCLTILKLMEQFSVPTWLVVPDLLEGEVKVIL